jgi:small subunit ribosomal protein S13
MGTTKVKPEIKEEKTKEKKVEKKKVEKPKESEELRAIVRVSGADIDGEKPLIRALTGIKGVSYAMSKAVISVSGFDPYLKLGNMGESDIQKIELIIKEPAKYGIPSWMLNRRKDVETGNDLHLTGADLDITKKFDIRKMVDLKTYKGVRHMLGLPVRGQRTRSKFRKGRVVGVVRKSVRMQMAKEGEKKEGKK